MSATNKITHCASLIVLCKFFSYCFLLLTEWDFSVSISLSYLVFFSYYYLMFIFQLFWISVTVTVNCNNTVSSSPLPYQPHFIHLVIHAANAYAYHFNHNQRLDTKLSLLSYAGQSLTTSQSTTIIDFVTQIFHKVMWQQMQGVVASLVITLLQISYRICELHNFENLSPFFETRCMSDH